MLKFENVTKTFDDKAVVTDLSFELHTEQYMYVEGKSGTGKTTILNLAAGLLQPDKGYITIDNKDVYTIPNLLKENISYLPCGNALLDALDVTENIQLVAKMPAINIIDILDELGITHLLDKKPYELSSGEYKRVAFVRTLAMDTPYLLLDEPTSNLDEESANKIIDVITHYTKDKGVLIATHDKRLMKGTKLCINE